MYNINHKNNINNKNNNNNNKYYYYYYYWKNLKSVDLIDTDNAVP